MASKGFVSALLNTLDAPLKRVLAPVFEHVLDNLRFGLRGDTERAENFQLYRFDATTNSTANQEFSITHGLGQSPYLLLQVLPLDSSGGQLVPLKVTRAADNNRIYLASASTAAAISVAVEI